MTEEWRDIAGYEGTYQVSNLGSLRRLHKTTEPKLLKQHMWRGYKVAHLSKRCVQTAERVHRIVARAFIPNPENKEQVNHINGDKMDNRVSNLEWVDRSENMLHRYRKLKTNCSNGSPSRRIRCVETGRTFSNSSEASEIMGGDPCTIRRCANGEKYSKTSGGYHWEYIK